MIWRVLGVAAISLWGSFSWRGGILDWLMPLLIPIITIMMLLPPCIINCLTRFFSSQVNKLQHAVPVQQGYIELQPTTENITHPQMDTAIRTLRPETSKRGSPMPLAIPAQQEVARETLMPLFPKNWASHLSRGECQVVRIGKRSPEWWWLKDKEGKNPQKQKKGRSEDQNEDLRQNKQCSWLAQFTYSRPRGRRKNIQKEEPKGWGSLSLSSFSSFGSACLHTSRMYFPLFSKQN